jgi:hypothetical protein
MRDDRERLFDILEAIRQSEKYSVLIKNEHLCFNSSGSY